MPIEINPDETATIVTDNEAALQRAIFKWIKFMRSMWEQVTDPKDESTKQLLATFGIVFRVLIIVLSTVVTTISDIAEVPRTVITILAGIMTVLTAIEAYFRFTERAQSIQQKQRELQALRDELRYRWMIDMELEPDFNKRMAAAKKLLESGPKAYNSLLNKYVLKSKESAEAPKAT